MYAYFGQMIHGKEKRCYKIQNEKSTKIGFLLEIKDGYALERKMQKFHKQNVPAGKYIYQ